MYRILIADDHADTAELWTLMLGELGHEVHIASNGVAALELARTLRPQVVLLDIGLPEMSGWDVARQLRKEFPPRQMLLVAFTGRGADEDRRRSLDAGFDYHFVKPIGIDTLEELLGRVDLLA